jgi:hypothetical protein
MDAFFDNIGKLVARLWEGGQAFLWGCAAACLLVFALLVGGWFLGFAAAIAALSAYGLLILSVALVLTALAIARTWQGWPKKTLFFVANEEQSLWGHSRQTSGEVITSLNFRAAVTNLSDTSVHLTKPRITWPLRARWCEEITGVLMTQNPKGHDVGQEFPIEPHRRSHISGVIALNRAILRPGKRLTFAVSVMDHRGRRHRIKFRRVRATNSGPV